MYSRPTPDEHVDGAFFVLLIAAIIFIACIA